MFRSEDLQLLQSMYRSCLYVLQMCFKSFFVPPGILLIMKTLQYVIEWYIDIKAYKFTVFEILRVFFFVLSYIACLCYPYI